MRYTVKEKSNKSQTKCIQGVVLTIVGVIYHGLLGHKSLYNTNALLDLVQQVKTTIVVVYIGNSGKVATDKCNEIYKNKYLSMFVLNTASIFTKIE